MAFLHPLLTHEKWNELSKSKQILNIAAELSRAARQARLRSDVCPSIERALELIDLSISDRAKWHSGALRELCRLREVLGEWYDNNHDSNRLDIIKLTRQLLYFHSETSLVQL